MPYDTVIYTAVFGDRDEITRPPDGPYDWRGFTDDEGLTDDERIISTPFIVANDPTRSARIVKILPHLFLPGYKRWIWIDGHVAVKDGADLSALLEWKGQIGTFRHDIRSCVYEERDELINVELDDISTMERQVAAYQALGYPARNGMASTGFLVRYDSPEVRRFGYRWWREVSLGSRRDQLSFNYVAWMLGISIEYLGTFGDNPWIMLTPHANGR